MRDAFGPLDEREELLVSSVAYVGDRVIHLEEEQSTERAGAGLPDTPCPSAARSKAQEMGGGRGAGRLPSSPRSRRRRTPSLVQQRVRLLESSPRACLRGRQRHTPPRSPPAPGSSASLPARLAHRRTHGGHHVPRATGWDAGTQLSLSGTAGIVAALRPGITGGADGPESAELRCARPCDQCGAASPRSAVCHGDGTEQSAREPSTARPGSPGAAFSLPALPAPTPALPCCP